MRVIEPSFKIETKVDGTAILKEIELFARNCYKSEVKITETSHLEFVRKLMHTFKHEGICDHHVISVRLICDRGVSHELVRHRIAAYLQESTRYCNYSGDVVFIRPPWVKPLENVEQYFTRMVWDDSNRLSLQDEEWYWAMRKAEESYIKLLEYGWKPEQARSVLPNSLKTEVIATLNLTSWRNFFKKRTATSAHPQMRQLSIPMLAEFKRLIPVVFDDIEPGQMPKDAGAITEEVTDDVTKPN